MKIIKEAKNEKLLLADFESILDNTITILFSEDTIEVPGVTILKREGKSTVLDKILNAELEVIEVENNSFDAMLETISVAKVENKLIFKASTSPDKTVILNLKKLKENAVFVKETETAIFVNNFIFTTDKLEYHGEGMFTSRKAFFVKELNTIKSLFN